MRYHCKNCGWSGDKPAHAFVDVTGGLKYKSDKISMSVCPYCVYVCNTLLKVYDYDKVVEEQGLGSHG